MNYLTFKKIWAAFFQGRLEKYPITLIWTNSWKSSRIVVAAHYTDCVLRTKFSSISDFSSSLNPLNLLLISQRLIASWVSGLARPEVRLASDTKFVRIKRIRGRHWFKKCVLRWKKSLILFQKVFFKLNSEYDNNSAVL